MLGFFELPRSRSSARDIWFDASRGCCQYKANEPSVNWVMMMGLAILTGAFWED